MNISDATYHIGTVSTSQTLTASYATGSATVLQDIKNKTKLVMVMVYTPKTGQTNRNMTTKLEFSYDNGTTWGSLKKGADATPASEEIITTTYDWVFKTPGATGGTAYQDRITVSLGDSSPTVTGQVLARVKVKEDGSADFGVAKVFLSAFRQVTN